jgi:toxin ParE1/3/4
VKEIVIARQARAELSQIKRKSRRDWGERRTADYMAAIDRAILAVARGEEQGRVRPDVGPGYRLVYSGRHAVVWRETDDTIFVVHVLHDRMDFPSRFSDS